MFRKYVKFVTTLAVVSLGIASDPFTVYKRPRFVRCLEWNRIGTVGSIGEVR